MSIPNILPSQEVLRSLLHYDPASGDLFWKERPSSFFKNEGNAAAWNARYSGKKAFTSTRAGGYNRGAIFGKNVYAQRVIWKWMTGEEPSQVDHENGVRSDNRWKNLRPSNNSLNSKNRCRSKRNTSGVTGVSRHKRDKRWVANIRIDGKLKWLGSFEDMEDAIAARKTAERENGFDKNHDREATI